MSPKFAMAGVVAVICASASARYIKPDPIGLVGGANRFVYAEDSPMINVDPTGLYTAAWHRAFTEQGATAAGMSKEFAIDLAQRVVDVDEGTQDVASSHMHAMCATRSLGESCERKYREYVRTELQKCTADGLAKAIHAVQDSFSRAHRGFQRYGGMVWLGIPFLGLDHFERDASPSRSERMSVPGTTKTMIEEWTARCTCPH